MESSQERAPAGRTIAVLRWVYRIIGTLHFLGGILNMIFGPWIYRKVARMLSLAISGLNCIQIPCGTALGVFMIIVLLRDSVREAYQVSAEPPE